MKRRILFFLYYFLYWMFFFEIIRLMFLCYNYELSFSMNIVEWGRVALYGAWMDASMSGYLSAGAAVLLAVTSFSGRKTVSRTLSVYTFILMFIFGIMTVGDMELYKFWGFRLDGTPLMYLVNTPKEAFASTGLLKIAFLLTLFVIAIYLLWKVYCLAVRAKLTERLPKAGWTGIPVFLLVGILMIFPIRGSLGVAPMNAGFVYHHLTNVFANHASVNVVWNAMKSLMESDKITGYRFMEREKAEALFSERYPAQENTRLLLNGQRPNVIVVMLESFSNRLIAPLGGKPDATPYLNRLCKESVVFSNIYSAGDRTDKGLLAVLSGYPAHPVARVINFPQKTRRLPFLNKDLKQAGYFTEHISGFDNKFANIRSYLSNAGYDRITDRDEFPSDIYRKTKWGVPDHYVFEKLLERCNDSQQPFFKSLITLSSHEPFDVPAPTVFEGTDDESRFINAACYTDRSLGAFIEAAKKTDWWANTLIVITADHGVVWPGNIAPYDPEKFHIPMIWTGGALAVSDTVITTVASQTDIARSILCQLGIRNGDYRFGKDILGSPVNSFAFCDFNNGFGWVTDSAKLAFDNVSNSIIFREGNVSDEALEQGKAYLQIFSDDVRK
ncbi:MAG: sulfatase-like hydrolase/transferase [Prevotellaceae bacterium]|jgi:phosphoglycerol transferase MdoB-like AlkP superfamily enzyme|nr:sulfatase-like hydrolase/transferase [Prevotellaceae bacterium]